MGPLHLSPNRDMTEEETDLFLAQCLSEGRAAREGDMPGGADDLPEAEDAAADAPAFEPVPGPRINGWTARRQRKFIEVLAQSGCVSEAAAAAGVTPRSAYRLRQREGAEGFDAAWNEALLLATNRLTALAPSTAC